MNKSLTRLLPRTVTEESFYPDCTAIIIIIIIVIVKKFRRCVAISLPIHRLISGYAVVWENSQNTPIYSLVWRGMRARESYHTYVAKSFPVNFWPLPRDKKDQLMGFWQSYRSLSKYQRVAIGVSGIVVGWYGPKCMTYLFVEPGILSNHLSPNSQNDKKG